MNGREGERILERGDGSSHRRRGTEEEEEKKDSVPFSLWRKLAISLPQDLAHSSRIIFPGWPISHRRELPVHAENARANPPDPGGVNQARICCAFCTTFLHAAPRHNSNRGGVASSSGERERESKPLAGINADSRQRERTEAHRSPPPRILRSRVIPLLI